MKIVLLGKTGYVGGWIHRSFAEMGHEVQTITVDVTDLAAVRKALKGIHDGVVINATGKTGKPNVDWCEDHRLETAAVNITGAINVCQTAAEQGNYVLQVGSGCIFTHPDTNPRMNANDTNSSGLYFFKEEDEPNFFGSFYSQTKAVVEGALKEIPGVCILRIRMPLQGSKSPKNLLNKLLNYDQILSVPNSVTVMEDFMPFIERVIEARPEGPLNAVNPGVYEHRDLLELYREMIEPERTFSYIGLEEFAGLVKAERSNCVLSTEKTEAMGIAMPPVSASLPVLLERYRDSLSV